MFQYEDWAKREAERKAEDATAMAPLLDRIRATEVRDAKLTGSPEWDSFLARLQALKDEADKQVVAWQDKLNASTTEHETREAQVSYWSWKFRSNTFLEVMRLPTSLVAKDGVTQ